jgi:hypothetical protein
MTMADQRIKTQWILENRDITKLKVKAVMNYPDDGMGRVWMMQKGGAA